MLARGLSTQAWLRRRMLHEGGGDVTIRRGGELAQPVAASGSEPEPEPWSAAAAAMVAEVPCNLTPRHPPSQVVDNLPHYTG